MRYAPPKEQETIEPIEENSEEVLEEVKEKDFNESNGPLRDIVTKEVSDNRDEHVLKITPSQNTEAVVVDTGTKFSDLFDKKVNFVDFYQDTRTFLAKANSTKFILISFLMFTIPLLLINGYVSEDVYKDMVILIAISYLGVDVYERKAMIKK